jgi:hypothetical protein
MALSQNVKGNDGEGVVYLFLAPSGMTVYGVTYAEEAATSEEAQKRRVTNFLAGVADSFVATVKKRGVTAEPRVSDLRRVKVAGRDGYELEVIIGTYVNITRVVTLGGKLYAVSAMRNGEGSASDRNSFFNSFQVLARS